VYVETFIFVIFVYLFVDNYKHQTIEAYDKNAKELSEKFKKCTDIDKRYAFKRFMDLLKGKKILDLGCGSGEHSSYFKEKGLDITAIDLSREMIRLCLDKKLNAVLMDIEHLDFENDSFDGIWAVTSLLHVPKLKLKDVIKKLNLILKTNGVLYVCVKEGKGEKFVDYGSSDAKRFFAFWEEDELKKEFENYFDLIELRKEQVNQDVFLKAFFRKI